MSFVQMMASWRGNVGSSIRFANPILLSAGVGAQGRRSCQPSTALVARCAMMSIVPTLLAAVVTSITIMSSAGPPATGGGLGCGTVSRFVCVHHGIAPPPASCPVGSLFLAPAAVRRHISATKSCREAGLGFREVHVEARAGDVMAGAGGGWPERVAVGGAPGAGETAASEVQGQQE